MSLGDFIRNAREGRGLSQEELAKLTDLQPTFISRLENNEFHTASTKVLKALAKTLKVNPDDLAREMSSTYAKTFPRFHDVVKELREKRGISQEHVARLAGLSTSLFNRIETGTHILISCQTLAKLEKALKARGKLWKAFYSDYHSIRINRKY